MIDLISIGALALMVFLFVFGLKEHRQVGRTIKDCRASLEKTHQHCRLVDSQGSQNGKSKS